MSLCTVLDTTGSLLDCNDSLVAHALNLDTGLTGVFGFVLGNGYGNLGSIYAGLRVDCNPVGVGLDRPCYGGVNLNSLRSTVLANRDDGGIGHEGVFSTEHGILLYAGCERDQRSCDKGKNVLDFHSWLCIS